MTHNTAPLILVTGDVMLDRYVYGTSSRLSPEAPVPVFLETESKDFLGGAGNVALNLKTLGSRVTLHAQIANDLSGEKIKKLCKQNNINLDCDTNKLSKTTTKTRFIIGQHQVLRVDQEDVNKTQKTSAFRGDVDQLDAVIVSDYAKGFITDVHNILELLKQKNVLTLVDPKSSNLSKYSYCDVITPNKAEFETIVGKTENKTELVERLSNLSESHEIGTIVVTLGGDGAVFCRKGDKPVFVPTEEVTVSDVAGAGDTFIASLAWSLASGAKMETSVRIANKLARDAVMQNGTSLPRNKIIESCEKLILGHRE